MRKLCLEELTHRGLEPTAQDWSQHKTDDSPAFVPVGNDINIVIPVKYALVSVSKPMSNHFLFLF